MCMVSGGLSSAIAQITGTVTDSTGEPLIGATVMISGTSTGTSADLDGNFSIDAKKARNCESPQWATRQPL